MSGAATTPRILHLHSSFDAGAAQLRTVRLINALGPAAEHAIVSGDPLRRGAARALGPRAIVTWPEFPPMAGKPWPARLKQLAGAMAGYDLVCTYNRGALDAALAHTLFADVFRLAPLVHHDDGFNEDEAAAHKPRGNFYRRIALGRSAAVVVPSRQLERIALEEWQQPRSRVRLIPEGIETAAFARPVQRASLPGLVKRKGELWLGTLADLSAADNLSALVRAFAALPEPWQLVIAGDGSERAAIVAEAERLGIDHRVHLPGSVGSERVMGLFDLFALSPLSEQAPLSLVEAMAAGLAVAAPRVAEVAAALASDNGPFLAAPGDEAALGEALARLAADPAACKRIGEANRTKARAEFDQALMVERYRALYWNLMGHARPA
ncbi:MAG: glycosyltransferase family 4 protein [Croceibacterium sp.]